jgi:hypothetical protein
LPFRPAEFDRDVAALDIAGFGETFAESGRLMCKRLGRTSVEEPDHRHCRLLRAGCERP